MHTILLWQPARYFTGWVLLLLLALPGIGRAQVDAYQFAASSGMFVPLPATATPVGSIQADDVISGALPIGFTFMLDGVSYTSVYASSNGILSFNSNADSNYSNELAGTGADTEKPLAAPFWDDLHGGNATAQASYQTTGTAPNRTFTMEWLNWTRYGFPLPGPSLSFQVQLVEGSNVIRFIYRQESNPLGPNAGASIGLAGPVTSSLPSDFLSLSSALPTAVASSTVETDDIATVPATGQVFQFSPPVPLPCATPRNLRATATTANSAQLVWTVNGGTGPFTVQYGVSGFNPALPSTAGNLYTTVTATGTSATVAGLVPSTGYQFYVTQNCGGTNGNSNRSNAGLFRTACITPVYATLPFTESFENTWLSRCDVREVPSNSWRNTPATGDESWRRDDDGVAGNWSSNFGSYTPAASQGNHSARFHSSDLFQPVAGTLDLFVDLSAAGTKRLSFDFLNTSGTDSLTVLLSSDGGLTFSRLAGYNLSPAFTTSVLPISSTSATAVLRFRAKSDVFFGSTDMGLDNIILEVASGCLTPASLTATTTTTTAALSWLTGGPGTYTLVYGPAGFNPTTGGTRVAGLAGPPYAVTGLTPGTTYQFYVTQNCAGGATSGTAGPGSFTTQIVNDEPCGATALAVNNVCQPTATTTVGASTTAPNGYQNGNNACGSFNQTPLDVWFKFTTAATGPTSTSVRLTVTGNPASFVEAFSAGSCTGPFTPISCAGNTSGSPAGNLDLLTLLPGTTYYVRVADYDDFQPTLGNFTICATPVPNCAVPLGLGATASASGAVLTWAGTLSAGGSYTVLYGPAGFNPNATSATGTAVTGVMANTLTLPASALLPNTAYDYYVLQVCGGFNGSSVYSVPFSFTTPFLAPANDEPCGATALTNAVAATATNQGATTSTQPGIGLPGCSGAQLPKDVWFTMSPTAGNNGLTLALTGGAAGQVRVFRAASCSAGPFVLVYCQASTGPGVGLSTATVPGLTAGTSYYIAVSGYSSSQAGGSFTLTATSTLITSSRTAASAELSVYPNPSGTGQLTLRLAGSSGPAGQATLLNALGQTVLSQPLTADAEQTLVTRGLAAGVYTLRLHTGREVLTRKVVLE